MKKLPKNIYCGAQFMRDKELYILVQSRPYTYHLIHLSTGNRWNDTNPVRLEIINNGFKFIKNGTGRLLL